MLKLAIRYVVSLAFGLGMATATEAADLGQAPAPPTFTQVETSPLAGFQVRGGVFASTWGAEKGEVNLNGEIVSPRLYTLQGWERYLIPSLQLGATGNVQGGTSYVYGGPMWTVDYDRYFADFSVGGAIHDGQLHFGPGFDPSRNVLGCRVLYHTGADLGYQIDDHWSGMLTFDHISNGAGTLSNCKVNQGATILGVRLGYRF